MQLICSFLRSLQSNYLQLPYLYIYFLLYIFYILILSLYIYYFTVYIYLFIHSSHIFYWRFPLLFLFVPLTNWWCSSFLSNFNWNLQWIFPVNKLEKYYHFYLFIDFNWHSSLYWTSLIFLTWLYLTDIFHFILIYWNSSIHFNSLIFFAIHGCFQLFNIYQ